MTYLSYAVLVLFYAVLVLSGVFFTGTAVMKLSRHQHMIEEFESMQIPYYLAFISGAIEIVCDPALIAGIWFPAAVGVAAAVMFCVMLAASITNLIATGRGIGPALGVLLVCAVPMLLIARTTGTQLGRC